MSLKTHNLGYPRIGARRELKKALESHWAGRSTQQELLDTAAALRKAHWITQRDSGIDGIPSNDFSFYDQTLDMSVLFGVIPPRFQSNTSSVDLDTYFTMARGLNTENHSTEGVAALEMTKWFDTNYHYLVPEFAADQTFALSSSKPLDEFREALALGIQTTPVLLGPVSFLLLGKVHGEGGNDVKAPLLTRLLPVYADLLGQLKTAGAEWVQIDEPCLCLDLTAQQQGWYNDAYRALTAGDAPKLMLTTYFGDLRGNLLLTCGLPIDGLHIDAVRAPQEVDAVCDALPANVLLSVGVVDGRNIWRNDFANSLNILNSVRDRIGEKRLIVSPSCSLLHSPYALKHEKQIDAEIKSWLAFAEEKLTEVKTLAALAFGEDADTTNPALSAALRENTQAIDARRMSARIHDGDVKNRIASVGEDDLHRCTPFAERVKAQQAHLKLPLFPTTTIGSFPQTADVRAARARFKGGKWSSEQYDAFLEEQTRDAVRWQEEIGVDVLVHGEFERNDMVEYFGERLSGFVFTQNGWVQSYGSRCVKPPVIFGDVSRPAPMTLRWTEFAQSLTNLPMKGMLTGPITILQWSFVRDDQPRSTTAQQIALALRDEVRDLEAAGVGVIQIDEPALREGLPLRHADQEAYLAWAGAAFRLASSGVQDKTQIHTHMCYCDFNDIMPSIADLDADVISIETARSQSELLDAFARFAYPNDIGPGVWDIHSPRVPSELEMIALLESYARVIDPRRLWVNPDCGLKTRQWEEVRPAMLHLMACARAARLKLGEHIVALSGNNASI